ncbi:membrane protein [Rhodopirellula maiorica SM1]|uniref:Membrane protein n=1 Tax=Rhodopirellula maiorica SM1 TaxID=1265738 RepID=M5REB0_9BACT|nr:hypothetical protein [Rhodopirellula maiorica]EMI17720.1 membrane protein [Rhodopirellula maiorica SM1]
MSSPYSPPLPHRPVVHRMCGIATRFIAGVFALLFVGIMIMAVYQLRTMILYGAGTAGPIPLVIATGFQLTILAVIIAMLWRLSNHFLYPTTHGFWRMRPRKCLSFVGISCEPGSIAGFTARSTVRSVAAA